MHNFNFPFIISSQNLGMPLKVDSDNVMKSNKTAIVVPYSKENDVLKVNSQTPEELKQFLDKGSFTSMSQGFYFSFVDVGKGKDIETKLAVAVKALGNKFNNIFVWYEGFDYNAIRACSEMVFQNKNEWNMKKRNALDEVLTPASIFMVDSIEKMSQESLQHGQAQAKAQSFVQYLVKLPGNILRPSTFAHEIQTFLEANHISNINMKRDGRNQIQGMGMGSFDAVSKGSSEEPALITMSYNGASEKESPYVFVGKGLTFDAGGISLKPSKGMDAMKTDMAGAATAAGIIIYASLMNLPINVVSILACCENMPDGNALKPGDVITAMNGKSIEVIDTDAEGRLVLADALCYSQKFKGKVTIDMATLTGACIVALGHVHTGLFSNSLNLACNVVNAGLTIKDTAWHMPMEGYEFLLESKIADMSNLKLGVGAGAQNGAIFLAEFAPSENWVHLDIAGSSEDSKGETGRPLPMLAQYLRNEVNQL